MKSTNTKTENNVNEPLDIFVCLDASGSMEVIRASTVVAFNTFMREQREEDKGRTTKISTILFNTQTTVLWKDRLISEADLFIGDYIPYGRTAMLDAIHDAIEAGDASKQNVLICVVSDGRENASRRFRYNQVRDVIQAHLPNEKWDIVFLTSDQHARHMAIEQLGIPEANVKIFECTNQGIRESFRDVSKAAIQKKRGQKLDASWKNGVKIH